MKRIFTLMAVLAISICAGAQTDVTEIYITNPQPVSNADGWNIEGTVTQFRPEYQTAEFWQQSGASISQTITLPAGNYRLTAVAYTRTGMTATLFAGDYKMNIATVGSSEVNSLEQAKTWLDAGNGVNELVFNMESDGNINIGLKADNTTSDYWIVWRSFKLELLIDESLLPNPPTFSIEAGVYGEEQTLTLTADKGLAIYYSLNGGAFTEYSAPLTISKTTTVEAYTVNADQLRSKYVSKKYYITTLALPTTVNSIEDLTPLPSELESGKYYYLYNVDAQMFLGRQISNSDYPNLRNYVNERILITKQSNGYYTMQFSNNNYYIYTWGSDCGTASSTSNRTYWRFEDAEDGLFYIQRNYDYNADQYLGWTSGNTYLYADKSSDASNNIRWQLIDADDDYYAFAQRIMLYKSIEIAGGSDLWPEYFAMLTDGAQTATSLYDAAALINKSVENAKTDAPIASWNEVPMTYWSSNTWYRSTDNNVAYYYSWCTSSRNSSGTCSLSARVNIEEASLLGFESYVSDENWSTTLTILVDGAEAKIIIPRQLENYYCYRNSEARETMSGYSSMYSTRGYNRYFLDLEPGIHTIEWRYDNPDKDGKTFNLRNIGILPAPTTISVNCVEPGSLGNEVLKQVNNVNDVRRLKISGPMNDDDWARIAMMTRLVSLDLSETTITSLPAKKFDNYTSVNWPFLHELKLPQGLTTIGDYCFRFSYVEHIDIPKSVTSIGEYAFYKSQIHEANVSENTTSIGEGAFARCLTLKDVSYQANMEHVPAYMFYYDIQMKPCELPQQIKTVRGHAFQYCNSFDTTLPNSIQTVEEQGFRDCYVMTSALPENLTTVGDYGFAWCKKIKGTFPSSLNTVGNYGFRNISFETLNIPVSVTSIGEYAFSECDSATTVVLPERIAIGAYAFAGCDKLNRAELPTSYYTITNDYIFQNCTQLKRLRLKSPTLVGGKTSTFLSGVDVKNITLELPDYLVSPYKLDSYWYNYGSFEGFNTGEVDYWNIYQPLTLAYDARFQGTPSLRIEGTGRLTINGETAMTLNNVWSHHNLNWPSSGACTMVLSNCDNVSVTGEMSQNIYTTGNVWYAMTLPFDFRPSDIKPADNAKFAIRYYDGASRATTGKGGNWKDIPMDSVITAGTGFIYRTSKNENSLFVAQNNGNKSKLFTASEAAVSLQANPSEDEAHKGWNLVGNPYMCYYNIHKLNTTAPITVYEHGSWATSSGYVGSTWYSGAHEVPGSYKAYSLVDDDYAMLPNGAFFLQCPDETTSVTFPTVGRQMTSEITDQNGVKAFMQQSELRKLIDLRLYTEGAEQTEDTEGFYDQTRVVFNPTALLRYERSCDAGKFMNDNKSMPQLYTIGNDDTRYAINERPTDDGTVQLGLYIPADGTYTLQVSRNRDAGTILLLDKLTGETIDITLNGYTFYAESGTMDDRFYLVAQSLITDVEEIHETHVMAMATEGGIQTVGTATIYGIDGRLVARTQGGFVPAKQGVYIVRQGRKSVKVSVK